jgi:hypothetical protein
VGTLTFPKGVVVNTYNPAAAPAALIQDKENI